jgi:spore coat protein U-like protein
MKMDSRVINLIALSTIAGNAALLADASESEAASAFAQASATIVATVTISKTSDLLLENMPHGGMGGTVTMPVTDTGPAKANASLLAEDADHNAATFDISGEGNRTYVLTLPASVSIKDASSTDITVHTFSGGTVGAGVLSGENQRVTVVGKLPPGEVKVAGNYTGSFNITIDYN